MALNNFFYRQSQRLQYHFASNDVAKRIAEINRFNKVITTLKKGYLVNEIDLLLPKKGFEFLFNQKVFELFMNVRRRLRGTYYIDNDRLYIKFEDVVLAITSQSELYIIDEVFNNRCYNFQLPFGETVRVMDIGMNVGISAIFFAGLPYVKKVYGYEPFAKTLAQSQSNFNNNPERASKIEVNSFGLGLKEESLSVVYDASNSGMNSTLIEKPRAVKGTEELVNIKPAADIVDILTSEYPDDKFVLKIDTEGSEYLIFDSLFCKTLPEQVKVVMLEWHFQGAHTLEKALLTNGFAITSFELNANSGLIYAFR